MSSIEISNGNNGFAHIAVTGAGTAEDPYVYQMGISLAPDVTSQTGWNNPSLDSKVPSEKLVKDTIDTQEITQASFSTSSGVLTLTKTGGNITVDLDGRYFPAGDINADTVNITNIELDNFKTSVIVTESEGIASNDNDTTIPTSSAVKDYVDNFEITSINADTVTVSNIELDNFKSSAIVTESEGIGSNDNDTTIPTSSAVKDYVDNTVIPDTNTFVNGASFNAGTRVLTLSLNNSTSLTVTIPGGTLSNLVEDTTPQLGGDLDLNNNDITGTGNIDITGDLTCNLNSGNVFIGNSSNRVEKRALTKNDVGLDNVTNVNTTNASNISSGTLADSILSSNVTLKGNSVNGANQLVLLNGSGFLPQLNGSLLTNLPGMTSDFVYDDTFSGSLNEELLDTSYITIRWHTTRKQFQFKLKSGSNYSSIGISINITRGNNNTNRGCTTTASASNAESSYFFFTGGTGSNSDYDTTIGRNVECYVCKSSYSASHPAYVIYGGAGGDNSFWARIAEIGG